MRGAMVLAIMLAGCATSSPPAAEPIVESATPEIDVWKGEPEKEILVVTKTWHGEGADPLQAYSQAAQPAAHPCLWNDGEEIYFTNQFMGNAGVPNGTAELHYSFSWDETSYPGDALRVGFLAAGAQNYQASAPVAMGAAGTIEVDASSWANPANRLESGWEFWACLQSDGIGDDAGAIFVGQVSLTITAIRG